MRVAVLGPLVVSGPAGPAPVSRPMQRALLAALVAGEGHPVSTERLIAELWPEQPPASATASLQMHVSGLRKVLGDVVRTTPGGYQLDLGADEVDAFAFLRLVEAEPAEALALWRGDAFDGIQLGPGAAALALRLHEQRQAARVAVARSALAHGRHAEVLGDLTAWVAQQPTDEALVGNLMLALHRSGRSDAALTAYADLQGRLADELDLEPSEELARLAAAVRRQDPTLVADVPGLPAQTTRFIGRRAELDAAAEALGRSRLLTIVGPGGVGKTRLAFQLAREVVEDHPGGIHVAQLAAHTRPPVGDPLEALALRVAASLHVQEAPGVAALEQLATHVGDGRSLLVLDNCEHLVDEAADLVTALLGSSTGLRVLVTSQEALGVPGEHVLELQGLRVPADDASGEEVLGSDAVRLLAQRAAEGGRPLALRPADHAALAELCRSVDGLPLALELLAPRLRMLGPRELAGRLVGTLDLLERRTGPARHRSMRAVISSSHEALVAPEQALFRRLGVFVGTFDLTAAEHVGAQADGPPPVEAADVLPLLGRLVDRSLVARVDTGGPSSRFRLLETAREFALEELERHGEEADARERHAQEFAARASVAPPMSGPEHADWLARMGADHDDLRALLARALGTGRQELALETAAALWWYWWASGQMAEGRGWLARALDATDGQTTLARARALRAAAALARNNGDLAHARIRGEESLAAFRALDDDAGTMAALNGLLMTTTGLEDFDAALALAEELIAMAERLGDRRMIAAGNNNAGGVLRNLRRYDEAQARFERALGVFGEIEDRRGEAASLGNLAVSARLLGRFDVARRRAREALRRYTDLDLMEGALDTLESLAHLDALEGDAGRALTTLLVCDRERERLGCPLFVPDEIADVERARQLAEDGLDEPARAAARDRAAALGLAELVDEALAAEESLSPR